MAKNKQFSKEDDQKKINSADGTGANKIDLYSESSMQLPAAAPRPLNCFIGREEILDEIKSIITKHSPSTTVAILGMGGIGKTALAKQIAEIVKADFAGGIFWGDELPTKDSNPNIILKQWGRICGENLENETDENLPSILRGLLARQQATLGHILVVIDDVRLDWQGDGLNIIKRALPSGIPMIITTRQAEIALEDDTKIFNLGVFSRSESCQLLQYLSDNKITPSNADTISNLCGDMPLALALIARLAKKRPIDWLLEQLQTEKKRLDILKLDGIPRKDQSVKISFDISYPILAQQHTQAAHIFRSLAAFSQPTFIIFKHFANTLAEVEKQKEFLRLSDWSLLSEEKRIADDNMQYFQMHTLLHEYAQSLLVETTEIDDAVKNHRQYCVDFLDIYPQLNLQTQQKSTWEFEKSYGQLLEALTQIKKVYLTQAIEWKNEPTLANQVISLVEATDHHWQLHHSQFEEQVKWLQIAYRCADTLNANLKKAHFARRVGRVLTWQGQLDDALEWMTHCEMALGHIESDQANIIRALMYIHRASILLQQNALEDADKNCIYGIDLAKKLINKKEKLKILAEGYNLFGVIKSQNGKLSEAQGSFEASLLAWNQVGDKYQINRVRDNMCNVLFYLGDFENLRKEEDESRQYWEQFPDRMELAMSLTNRGLLHYVDQEYDTAITLQKRAMEISNRIGAQRILALTKVNIAWPYIALKKYAKAKLHLTQSLKIQAKYNIKENWNEAQRAMAEVAIGNKLYAQAIEIAENVIQLAQDPLERGTALRVLGQAHYLNTNLAQAKTYLEESLGLLSENDYRYESFLTLQLLIKLYKDGGEIEKAQTITKNAHILFKEMGLHYSLDMSSNTN